MMKKLIIFDLDGTLAESKQPLTSEMAVLVSQLLNVTNIAVISGGALSQFLKQIIAQLPINANLANLYLLPTSGAALYEYGGNTPTVPGTSVDAWKKIYEERISEKEKNTIETVMCAVAKETGVIDFSEHSWGERIEYRGSQVTLSALGQHAPVALKKAWDPDHAKRKILQIKIAERLPEFSVTYGGATSIDVTRRGIDKAYGVRKLCERLGIPESEAFYVGDELEAGGNDEALYTTDVPTKSVKDPVDTTRLIESILSTS